MHTTLACSKKSQNQSKQECAIPEHTATAGPPEQLRLLSSRASLGAPALPWKKLCSLLLGSWAGMAGWGPGGMRGGRNQESTSNGRARVFELVCLFVFSL